MRMLLDCLRAAWGGLRCRPGDVCWVLRDAHGATPSGRPITVKGGTVVRVERIERGTHAMWRLAEPLDFPDTVVTGLHDSTLQPLRDRPGRDEIFRYAVPPEFTEAAASKPAAVDG